MILKNNFKEDEEYELVCFTTKHLIKNLYI
jgi:hypothetical protein